MKGKTVRLTAALVDRLQREPGDWQTTYWDTVVSGLGLRGTPQKAWEYFFLSDMLGFSARLAIGDSAVFKLSEARAAVRVVKRAADSRKDAQILQDRCLPTAPVESVTVGEAYREYIETCRPYWDAKLYLDHIQFAKVGPLAVLCPLKLSELTSDKVTEWVESRPTIESSSYKTSLRRLFGFLCWVKRSLYYPELTVSDAYTARLLRKANEPRDSRSPLRLVHSSG
jgi:hypothetical protein